MNTKKKVLDLLRAYEPANMLWIAPDGSWPIVWDQGQGNECVGCGGPKYLDLTAAFGVAAAGHGTGESSRRGNDRWGNFCTPWAMFIRIR